VGAADRGGIARAWMAVTFWCSSSRPPKGLVVYHATIQTPLRLILGRRRDERGMVIPVKAVALTGDLEQAVAARADLEAQGTTRPSIGRPDHERAVPVGTLLE